MVFNFLMIFLKTGSKKMLSFFLGSVTFNIDI